MKVPILSRVWPLITAYAKTILASSDAATTRTTLGVGTGDSPTFAGLTVTDPSSLVVDLSSAGPNNGRDASGLDLSGNTGVFSGLADYAYLLGVVIGETISGPYFGFSQSLSVTEGFAPSTDVQIQSHDGNTYFDNSGFHGVGAVIAGAKTATGAATTTFTVTIGVTMSGTTYKVATEGNNALSSAIHYVNNKTTTTFDVVYLAGLTGAVAFDWIVTP